MKINLSLDKVTQVQSFLGDIIVAKPSTQRGDRAPAESSRDSPTRQATPTSPAYNLHCECVLQRESCRSFYMLVSFSLIYIHFVAALSKIGSLECVCNQMVVAMDTGSAEENAKLFGSLEEIQLEINVIHNDQNEGKRVPCFLMRNARIHKEMIALFDIF